MKLLPHWKRVVVFNILWLAAAWGTAYLLMELLKGGTVELLALLLTMSIFLHLGKQLDELRKALYLQVVKQEEMLFGKKRSEIERERKEALEQITRGVSYASTENVKEPEAVHKDNGQGQA